MKLFYSTVIVLLLRFCLSAQPPSDLKSQQARKEHFETLKRQIFYAHDDDGSTWTTDPGKRKAVREKLRQMVAQELQLSLQRPNATENDASAAIRYLQSKGPPSETIGNAPFAKIFTTGGTETIAVAYDLAEGGGAIPDNHPYLEFYTRENGAWKKKAQAPTGSEFEGCTFNIEPIKTEVQNEAWFLVSGFRYGDTGTRLKIRLYSFDGSTVRTVWQRSEILRGVLSVSNNYLTLEWDRKYHSPDPHNRAHAEYRVVPEGIECILGDCQ